MQPESSPPSSSPPSSSAPSAVVAGPPPAKKSAAYALFALALALVNTGLWILAFGDDAPVEGLFYLFTLLAILQVVAGITAVVYAIKSLRAKQGGVGTLLGAIVLTLGAPVGWFLGVFSVALTGLSAGGAWGRPLRIRGRQLHPQLREGSDWTRGDRPDPAGLDEPTRAALEALWLHDAQKEHASVPAFSRIAWLLAAVGAPAELLEWSHRAAIEEIEHTRACFALAAGYAGRSHTVEAMPELLLGIDGGREPLVTLAIESLGDGCQLEDFNADVAAACAEACREPVTRAVLETIAREERTHADFSWALLAWLLERDAAEVGPAIEGALARLHDYPRPTAVSHDKRALVAAADPDRLRAHGRLPDARWAELWDQRLVATTARVRALLDPSGAARAA